MVTCYSGLSWPTSAIALVVTATFLSSCSVFTGYPPNYQNTSSVITADSEYLSANVIKNEYSDADADRGNLNKKNYRDVVVYVRLEVIDINYYTFESKLSTAFNSVNLGSDLAALALNGLGATIGSSATKAALAAASAGVIGAKGAVDTDLFYQKTLPALVAQMRADRQTALLTIRKGLAQTVTAYPLDAALIDVNNYYIAGTLPSAVAQVTANAGAQLEQANKAISVTRDATFIGTYSSRAALETKIANLTDAEALSVYNKVKQYIPKRSNFVQSILKQSDPRNAADTNGASAKALLEVWIVNDPLNNGFDAQIKNAITVATGTK